MAAEKKRKCKISIIYQAREYPVMRIELRETDDHQQDLFYIYWDMTGKKVYVDNIAIPSMAHSKKNNENINNNNLNEKKIITKPKPTSIVALKYWEFLKNYYYNKCKQSIPILSSHTKFQVEVFKIKGYGILFMFYNEWDGWIEIYANK